MVHFQAISSFLASATLTKGIHLVDNIRARRPRTQQPTAPRPGRYWSEAEHERFLEGIKIYGTRDARALSEFIGSRTPTQGLFL